MEVFKNGEEFKGLLNSAKVLDVNLFISDDGFIVIEKKTDIKFVSIQFQPKWNEFSKAFWVPIILKKMNIVAEEGNKIIY